MEEQAPIRIAVLGGDCTGKTALVSRLSLNMVHEVHYPTRNQNNWLFDFVPKSILAKTILDSQAHTRLLLRSESSHIPEAIFSSPEISPTILLSPLVFQSFINDFNKVKTYQKSKSSSYLKQSELNDSDSRYYSYTKKLENTTSRRSKKKKLKFYNSHAASFKSSTSECKLPVNYVPPSYSPIPIDIIDTPGFKPEVVVPFLEVSLFRILDKDILQGLADEPRKPVSTTSLLVASGASELNGKIDGYIYVYSAVPELTHRTSPPSYETVNPATNDSKTGSLPSTSSTQPDVRSDIDLNDNNWSIYKRIADGGYSLLTIIRNSILDAWTEYRNYQNRWDQGKETDVYSLVYSFKNMWKTDKERDEKLSELRKFKTTLDTIDLEPSSPNSPPPAMIVCTHLNDPLASPIMIEKGKELATQWNCGFVALDSMDNCNVDVALSLLIREIAEKDKLLSNLYAKSHSSSGSNSIMNFMK